MNGSQPPDRKTDPRRIPALTDGRGWRFAKARHPFIGRRPSPGHASRAAWLLLGDGRPALGISRPG